MKPNKNRYAALKKKYGIDYDAEPTYQDFHDGYLIRKSDGEGFALSRDVSDIPKSTPHTEEVGNSGTQYMQGVATNTDSPDFMPTRVRGVMGQPGTYQKILKGYPLANRVYRDMVLGLAGGTWKVTIDMVEGKEKECEALRTRVERAIENLDPHLSQVVSQALLSWAYGFVAFETLYDPDTYDLASLKMRRPSTVKAWIFDEFERVLEGIELTGSNNKSYTLTADQSAIARWFPEGSDPEGNSQLRSVVKLIEASQLLEQIQMASAEARGAGLLAVYSEKEGGFAEDEQEVITQIIDTMIATEQPYFVGGYSARIEMISPAGMLPDFEATQARLADQIAQGLSAEYARVGSGDTGSYNLAEAKHEDVQGKLKSVAAVVEDLFNNTSREPIYRGLIRRMVDYQGGPIAGVYPKLEWVPPTKDVDWSTVIAMYEKGLITKSEPDEIWIREGLSMPAYTPASQLAQAFDNAQEGEASDQPGKSSSVPVVASRAFKLSRSEPDIDRIEKWLQAADNAMGQALRRVAAEHRDTFVLYAKNVEDPNQIAEIGKSLRASFEPRYENAVRGQIMRLVAAGSASTLQELGVIGKPVLPSDPQEAVRRYAMVSDDARQLIDATSKRIGDHAFNVSNDALVAHETKEALQKLPEGQQRKKPPIPTESALAKTARRYSARPFSFGRSHIVQAYKAQAEMRGYPAQVVAEYSSVLETSTCATCRALDGTRAIVGSAEYLRISPPNQCEGGDRCRCIWSYIMPDEQGYEEILDALVPGWRS